MPQSCAVRAYVLSLPPGKGAVSRARPLIPQRHGEAGGSRGAKRPLCQPQRCVGWLTHPKGVRQPPAPAPSRSRIGLRQPRLLKSLILEVDSAFRPTGMVTRSLRPAARSHILCSPLARARPPLGSSSGEFREGAGERTTHPLAGRNTR